MPITINPVRKALVKKSLLKGSSIRQALKDAGYSPGTQRGKNNGTTTPVVKVCQEEILRDIKKEITVESVLDSLKHIQQLAIAAEDFSTATRCEELCGKWLAMFTDKSQQEVTTKSSVEQDADIIERLRLSRLARLDVPSMG